ncbi:MAG: BamA/OMP85 family outer membrane protein, partial [bacterium]
QGYLSAKTNYTLKFGKNKKSVIIYIDIIKNIRTYVKSVSIKGLPLSVKNKVINYFNKMINKPLKIIKVDNGKNLIETELSNSGYIFSKTRLKIIYSKNESKCYLYYSASKSQQVIIKHIFITGNTITKTGYIKSLILFKKGQVYNQSKIIKTQNDLYKTGLFNSVVIKLENSKNIKKYKKIVIKVKDSKPISLSFGAGYGTYTRYRGFFQISDDNLFGLGKSLSIRLSKSAIYTNLLADYYDPSIYNYKNLAFNAEALDSDIITLNYTLHQEGTSFSLIRKFNHNLKGLLSYSMFYDNLSGLNLGAQITPRDIGFTRISSIETSLIYNSKNNIFNPTSGNFTDIRLTYSSAILDSQINFIRLFAHTEEFIPFIYGTVLECSLRFGYIKPIAPTTQVPINERYFLGGRTTVRGFPQYSIGVMNQYGYAVGGDVMENYNLQLNIPVYHNIDLFVFQDGGNVFLTPSEIKPLALYKSAGAGIMYLSPIGPISFSYGLILTRKPYWPSGGVNFTIGTSF